MQINPLQIVEIAEQASLAILEIYHQPSSNFEIEKKDDNSPLTLADKKSNEVIIRLLKQYFPHIPYISEETKLNDYAERKNWEWCWLIDPLDGTKEFIKRNGEFTVNIALIHRGEPVLGVVSVPVENTTYFATKNGGSHKKNANGSIQKIQIAPILPTQKVYIIASRSHQSPETQQFITEKMQQYGEQNIEIVSAGSSLKFCMVAEGKAHFYPRLAPTMEWDTAAGQIVATEAGAKVVVFDTQQTLTYNRPNLLNPHFLVTV